MGSFSHDYVYQFVTPLQPQASIPYELQLGHIHCRWFHGTLEQKGLSTDVCGCLWIWAMGHKNVNVWQELSSLFTNPESEAKEILPQLICGVNHPDCLHKQSNTHWTNPIRKLAFWAGIAGTFLDLVDVPSSPNGGPQNSKPLTQHRHFSYSSLWGKLTVTNLCRVEAWV